MAQASKCGGLATRLPVDPRQTSGRYPCRGCSLAGGGGGAVCALCCVVVVGASETPFKPSLNPFNPSPSPFPNSGKRLAPKSTRSTIAITRRCVGCNRSPNILCSFRAPWNGTLIRVNCRTDRRTKCDEPHSCRCLQ